LADYQGTTIETLTNMAEQASEMAARGIQMLEMADHIAASTDVLTAAARRHGR
jgi:hypothetical protein